MEILPVMDISGSALSAERLRMDVIANNVANANMTRGPDGGPYRRKEVVFQPRNDFDRLLWLHMPGSIEISGVGQGVRVRGVVEDARPFRRVYDPGHPDANADGYVLYPNFNVVEEMVDMISATRAYQANLSVIQSAKDMALQSLTLLQG